MNRGGFGSRSIRECQRRLGFHRDGHGRPGTGFTSRQRGDGVHQPSRPCPVERGAARVARHVRERLLEVIPGHQPGVISSFYLMARSRPRMRASGKCFAVEIGEVVWFEAGAERRFSPNPPAGSMDHSSALAGPFGCKARKVRITHAGVGSRAVATPTRRRLTTSGYPLKTRNAKSSTMKGASSPCQSAAAETEPDRERPGQEG